jgi:hypothetical protein
VAACRRLKKLKLGQERVTADLNRTRAIVDLLEQTTTLTVVSAFLKAKGLHHTGSWPKLRDERIIPAVTDNSISNDDLIGLLRSAEECGSQHIFLYKCSPANAIAMMDRQRVAAVLQQKGLSDLLVQPRVLDQPATPTMADVRWEVANVDLNLTIKEVEQRTHVKYHGTETEGNFIRRVYELKKQRAVNLFKLDRHGNLEVRVRSKSNGTQYEDDVDALWGRFAGFIDRAAFKEIGLDKAKDRLLNERKQLTDMVRYSNSKLKNKNGISLDAATGAPNSDLFGDSGAEDSIEAFLSQNGAYCEASNIWFKVATGLSSELHVLLSGEPNEFAITANCTEGDYAYVLNQIRHLNK